jgi:hypothetical protein
MFAAAIVAGVGLGFWLRTRNHAAATVAIDAAPKMEVHVTQMPAPPAPPPPPPAPPKPSAIVISV